MKSFSICVLLLFSPIYAQVLPWSAPQLLCDSIGDNLNPSFAKTEYGLDYNLLLWERDYGDRSRIFMKAFSNPDSEIALGPDVPGVYARNPVASYFSNWSDGFDALIVWQANVNGNFDLFSVFYDNAVIRAYQQITSDPGDDLNPNLCSDALVWERNGNIYYSQYSFFDSTWSSEFLVDSFACKKPVISWLGVAYQKGGYTRGYEILIRKRDYNQNWLEPQCILSEGDNQYPVWGGYGYLLFWQHKMHQGDWNIMSWADPDTGLFVFSASDETRPVGLDVAVITAPGDEFWAPMYLAFESNVSGEMHIYTHDIIFDYQNCYNISQGAGPSRNPIFSSEAWAEATTYSVRYWLAWESYRNGDWQIWGSFSEMEMYDVEEPKSENNLTAYQLFQNYPNPFNPTTTISWQLAVDSKVELAIYNLLGQKVRTLVNARQSAGVHEVEWEGLDDAGQEVASGIYIYQIKAGDVVRSRKMLLVR